MKLMVCQWLPVWVWLFCFAPTILAQPATRIARINIRHVGPPAVSDELIRANIRIKEGDSYSKLNIDNDVRNLYGTGYFYNIRVGEETTPDGIVLTYVVQGKPLLTDIKFVGNKKFSATKLLNKIRAGAKPSPTAVVVGVKPEIPKGASKVGEPLDERKLFEDAQEIQKMYQKAGYQKTQVKYVLNIDENAGRGTVTFEITESPKVKILRVEFEGARAFKQKKLRKVI